jgi:lipoprotein-releasing system permease protein
LNFPLFIADRLRKNQILNFSATVYRIGVGSIAIGLAVMIVAFAVFFGFKSVVKQKIFSLSGQIQIKKFTRNESFEETPLLLSSALYKIGNSSKSLYIKNIQAVSHKTCILQTNDDLLGVLLKGVGKDYNWANFDLNMIQGQTLNFADSAITNQILISNIIAQKLQLRVASIFFAESAKESKICSTGHLRNWHRRNRQPIDYWRYSPNTKTKQLGSRHRGYV